MSTAQHNVKHDVMSRALDCLLTHLTPLHIIALSYILHRIILFALEVFLLQFCKRRFFPLDTKIFHRVFEYIAFSLGIGHRYPYINIFFSYCYHELVIITVALTE